MNKAELVEVLSAEYDGNKAEAAKALDAVLRSITYQLATGGNVILAGFGIFEAVARPARTVRDPETGRQRRIKSPATPHFRAGAELKAYTSGVKKPTKPYPSPTPSRRAAAARIARLIDDRGAANLARHVIEFDPKEPAQYLFSAPPSSEQAVTLAARAEPPTIPWPAGLAPRAVRPDSRPTTTAPLPRADVLIVTSQLADAHALADVLTPGWAFNRWYRYRNNWRNLKRSVQAEAPSVVRDQAGRWAMTRVGDVTAVLVKTDLHPCLDGDPGPVQSLLEQILDQVQPRLVIGAGSAGGLGPDVAAGDVLVSRHLRWHPVAHRGAQQDVSSTATSTAKLRPGQFVFAEQNLLPDAREYLEVDRERRLFVDTSRHRTTVITTDFFTAAADRAELLPHVQSARGAEMGDAPLGLACSQRAEPIGWVSVRTAFDAQSDHSRRDEGRREAASAYERLGYWASVSSAIVCWSLLAPPGSSPQHRQPS